jgi:hypothetical protein
MENGDKGTERMEREMKWKTVKTVNGNERMEREVKWKSVKLEFHPADCYHYPDVKLKRKKLIDCGRQTNDLQLNPKF